MIVRTARHGDLADLLELFAQLHENEQPAPSVLATQWNVWGRVLGQEGRVVLLAEDEDEGVLLGAADLLIVPNITHDGRPWAIVERVVVTRARRRQGVGRLLMQAAIRRATAAGCYKLQLLTRRERTGAHRFYEALGFQAVAEGFRLTFP